MRLFGMRITTFPNKYTAARHYCNTSVHNFFYLLYIGMTKVIPHLFI